MTIIAEAQVIVRPVTQNFSKELDAQVQQALGQTNKKAVVSPTVSGKNLARDLDKQVSGGINLVNKKAIISPKIDDKGQGSKFSGVLGKIDQNLQKVGKSGTVTSEVLGKLGVTGHRVGSLLSSGIAVGTAAAAAAVTAFAVKGIHDFISLGTEVRQFQVISGATAQDASRLVAASDALGVSSQAAGTGVFFLEKNLEKTAPKLGDLGIAVARTADGNLDLSRTFLNVADAVSRTEDPALRAQIAVTAFGKGGKALLPILEQGRKGIQDLFDEAAKHGQILDQKQVDNAFQFKLALHELGQESQKFGRDLGSTLVPAISAVIRGLDTLLVDVGKVGGFLQRNVFAPLGKDFHTVIQDPIENAGKSLVHFLHIPQDTGFLKKFSQDLANQAAAAGLDADQIKQLQIANGLIPVAANAAATATADQAAATDKLAQSQAEAAAAEKHHINQLNALGSGITHVFGDTKHQVLEWQKTLNNSLNFVASNLGSIASQLDQDAKKSGTALDSAAKANTNALNRVQLAQDRLAVFQAKHHDGSKLSAADLAHETLLQDQLSQAKGKAADATDRLASAQRKDSSAAKEVLQAFDQNLQQMVAYRKNLDSLIARNAPANLIKQLTDLGQSGSSVVAALASANSTQFDKIVRDWRHARDQAPGVSKDIRHAFIKDGEIKIPVGIQVDVPHTKKTLADFRTEIRDQLEGGVPITATPKVTTPTMNVTATTVNVSASPREFGGPVGANQTFLVGEKGPELFVPKTSGNIIPNNKLGGFTSQDVDRIIAAIEKAVALSRPINVTEVAQSPVATAEAVAARLGLAGVR